MLVNVAEAKAQLSKLIERARKGERVVIARNNVPVADLVPHRPAGKRRLGALRGKVDLDVDLIGPDRDIEEMFFGADTCS